LNASTNTHSVDQSTTLDIFVPKGELSLAEANVLVLAPHHAETIKPNSTKAKVRRQVFFIMVDQVSGEESFAGSVRICVFEITFKFYCILKMIP
jgi:hypothetical protein